MSRKKKKNNHVIDTKKNELRSMLDKINDSNKHSEIEFGLQVGIEYS